ncbi:MAG: sulfate adenylyltransferase subunit CysD [Alphaproteobacteria bacterium]|nr:sulfate adenylyltransferase subunit CysD [Alphaproteobacteria bacterium]
MDDDEPVRESLRRMLTAHGLATAVFASGRQLLASDQLPETSCLIADVKMPEMSGLALHHRLMAAGHRIPTILITGGPTTSGRNQALAEGVLSYVPKPLSEETLLDNVRLALQRSVAGSGSATAAPPTAASESAATAGDLMARRPRPTPHLKRLEAESIAILREVAAEFRNPVLMYSIGKDSSVLLHLARKAFHPAKPPLPLLHIDTTWKFREMIAFRDDTAKRLGLDLIVHVNQEGLDRGIDPISSGSSLHTQVMKTEALKQALDKHGFDAAIGGARRDEEKSRAKERIFSFRNPGHVWDPRHQRPELWRLYNTRLRPGESMRVFPLSNWTELDVWQYIEAEGIEVVPLYFAKQRPVVQRGGVWIMVDDERLPLEPGESPELRQVRFRTLGCYPLSGAIESEAATVGDIVAELRQASRSERQGRLIDSDTEASMERKKREGYF